MEKTHVTDYLGVPQAVLLANGAYPTHPYGLHLLQQAPYVVCCDGAAERYLATGRIPQAIVGDGDSLSQALRMQYADLFIHVTEQDDNDLTKAFRYLRESGIQHITILGATGKREDHTLGNISLLMSYHQAGASVTMLTDTGIFIPVTNNFSCTFPMRSRLSIFNFGATQLSATGLAYPLYDFTSLWQGTLNHSISPLVTVTAQGDFLLFWSFGE